MRLSIRDPAAQEWIEVGVMLREGGRLTFHPRPGFEVATVRVSNAADLASDRETVEEAWEYYRERGVGGLSVFSEPGTLEGASRAEVAARLNELVAHAPLPDPDRRSDREGG